ncbi:PhoX family protein [Actinomadura alba]|nr:alkaline phosphatase PhoX [Actinomadura alba]
MSERMRFDRRSFLLSSGVLATGVVAAGSLDALAARPAGAAPRSKPHSSPDYGPLRPVRDQATGLELILLPEGFEYISYGWTGDRMSDGRPTPGAHDGMGAFRPGKFAGDPGKRPGGDPGVDHKVWIVRNHEINDLDGAFIDAAYDPMASGGTSNVVFDTRKGEFVESWASLSGTIRNCGGGVTPWGTWLSCEETDLRNGEVQHGYIFEVPHDGVSSAKPYKAMGRFVHEAAVVDPKTGWVYMTEDDGPTGLYRFRPNKRGKLDEGVLEMLAIGGSTIDTGSDPTGVEYGDLSWVRIDNPDPAPSEPSVGRQGIAKGAASFAALEGAYYHDGKVFFVASGGGPTGEGQVFVYDLRANRLKVLIAPTDTGVLNNPDNVCVSPRGGIMLCDDGSGNQFLRGLTQDGEIFHFAQNNLVVPSGGIPGKSVEPGDYSWSEWAGATFDPKGEWLFVNIQTPGVTLAITGPWGRGSL